jgi:hypothetical protein
MSVGSLNNNNNNIALSGIFNGLTLDIINNDGSIFTTLTNSYDNSLGYYTVNYAEDGSVIWAAKIISSLPANFLEHSKITVDKDKNVYLLGWLYQNVDIYNANGTFNNTINFVGFYTYIIVKYDAINGNAIWTTKITCNDYAEFLNITSDSENNIYIVGAFQPVLYIYNSDGTLFLEIPDTTNISYSVILKYNNNGFGVWTNKIKGATSGETISTDINKNVYITGRFPDSVSIDIYNLNETIFSTFISYDINHFNPILINNAFLVKYNDLGEPLWHNRIVSNSILSSVNYLGNYFIYAKCKDTLIVYNADNTLFASFPYVLNSTQDAGFLVKYDTDGNPLWISKLINNQNTDNTALSINNISLDINSNIYLSGFSTYNQLDVYDSNIMSPTIPTFSILNGDAFTIKYDTIGVAIKNIVLSSTPNNEITPFSCLNLNSNIFIKYRHVNTIQNLNYEGNILVKYDNTLNSRIWINKIGQYSESSIQISSSIFSVPKPPINIVVENGINYVIFIHWQPYPNQTVEQYNISAFINGVFVSNELVSNVDAVDSFIYTNVILNTYYTFSITAINLNGESLSSQISEEILVQYIAEKPVLTSIGTTQNEYTVTASWTTETIAEAPILGYIVSLSNLQTIISQTIQTESFATFTDLDTGFNNDIAYFFTIIAYNKFGNTLPLISPFVYPFKRIVPLPQVIYKKLDTGGNDPKISKAMRYSQYVKKHR